MIFGILTMFYVISTAALVHYYVHGQVSHSVLKEVSSNALMLITAFVAMLVGYAAYREQARINKPKVQELIFKPINQKNLE
jgi:multisubunit Na+/H+ antiporter MnhG subunit